MPVYQTSQLLWWLTGPAYRDVDVWPGQGSNSIEQLRQSLVAPLIKTERSNQVHSCIPGPDAGRPVDERVEPAPRQTRWQNTRMAAFGQCARGEAAHRHYTHPCATH